MIGFLMHQNVLKVKINYLFILSKVFFRLSGSYDRVGGTEVLGWLLLGSSLTLVTFNIIIISLTLVTIIVTINMNMNIAIIIILWLPSPFPSFFFRSSDIAFISN